MKVVVSISVVPVVSRTLRPTITDRVTGCFGIYTALRLSVKATADVSASCALQNL